MRALVLVIFLAGCTYRACDDPKSYIQFMERQCPPGYVVPPTPEERNQWLKTT